MAKVGNRTRTTQEGTAARLHSLFGVPYAARRAVSAAARSAEPSGEVCARRTMQCKAQQAECEKEADARWRSSVREPSTSLSIVESVRQVSVRLKTRRKTQPEIW